MFSSHTYTRFKKCNMTRVMSLDSDVCGPVTKEKKNMGPGEPTALGGLKVRRYTEEPELDELLFCFPYMAAIDWRLVTYGW